VRFSVYIIRLSGYKNTDNLIALFGSNVATSILNCPVERGKQARKPDGVWGLAPPPNPRANVRGVGSAWVYVALLYDVMLPTLIGEDSSKGIPYDISLEASKHGKIGR